MQFYLGSKRVRLSPVYLALAVFLICLTVAGGASRADAGGQVIVRSVAWIYLAGIVLFATRPPVWRGRPIFYLLAGAATIAIVQLIPLPPALWNELPGRASFNPPTDAVEEVWRPLAIVPSAALNAAYSLVVPAVAFVLMATSHRSDDRRLVALLVGLAFAATLAGLTQLTGLSLRNPLVNSSGDAAGTFANRNHFALFLALGCLLTPVWAFQERGALTWRAFAALALIPLFLLTILATGSRAGTVVGILGLFGGGAVVFGNLRAHFRQYPGWVIPGLVGIFLIFVALMVLVSADENRAASITRLLALDVSSELRGRALPTVLIMVREYFPVGTGFGGFDPIFRLHEPDPLLGPEYFNRVHNDLIEVVLDGGLPAALLLIAGLGWWLWATFLIWRLGPRNTLAKTGSLMILLIVVASLFDYPARTPMMMALLVIAGVWLSDAASSLSLPRRHLRR